MIRVDNRDIGLSTKMNGQRIEGSALLRLLRTELGASSRVPYTLKDMALDAKGIDCTDKSDDYIEARFDALTADAKPSETVESFTPRANVTTDAAATVTALRTARYS